MFATLHEIISGLLMFIGAFFMLVASLGVLRLPDLYLRMAATSKAASLGSACALIALAVYFLDIGIATRAIIAVVFLFMTAPIAAHMIGRAAYTTGVPLWEDTVTDELHGRYNKETRVLSSYDPDEEGALASAE